MRTAPLLLGLATLSLVACSGSSSSSKKGVFQAGAVAVTSRATTIAPVNEPASAGKFVPCLVRESDVGQDLNGDLDLLDDVVHVVDSATGIATGIGLATPAPLVIGSSFFGFLRDEATELRDLNADGDQLDRVLFVGDLATGTVRNVGFAVGAVHAIGPRMFFEVPEAENGGLDLNNNMVATDHLFFEHSPSTGFTTNTKFLYPGPTFTRRGDTIVFASPTRLIVYDLVTRFVQIFPIIAHDLTGSGDCLAFTVFESEEASDLNLDGDQLDSIVFIYDFRAGFLRNTRIPRDDSVGFAFSSEFVAFQGYRANVLGMVLVDILSTTAEFVPVLVREMHGIGRHFVVEEDEAAIAVDLNGDGDSDDFVASFVDSGNLVAKGLGIAVSDVLVRGEVAFLAVDEGGQGNTDLNGDGDSLDTLLHRFDATTEVTQNTGLQAGVLGTLADQFLFLNVREGTSVLNEDGDTADAVLHVLDLNTDRIQNLKLAVDESSELRKNRFTEVFPVLVSEAGQGRDLNGDADTNDKILHYFLKRLP